MVTNKRKKNEKVNLAQTMPTFTRSSEEDIWWPARKQTLNPKLTSKDNVHKEAIKWRWAQEEHTRVSHSAVSRNSSFMQVAQPKPTTQQPSIEDVTDEDKKIYVPNAGPPKNLNAILKADNDVDVDTDHISTKDVDEEDDIQQETDDQELGIVDGSLFNQLTNIVYRMASKGMALTNLSLLPPKPWDNLHWKLTGPQFYLQCKRL